jgi:hypothetical protein
MNSTSIGPFAVPAGALLSSWHSYAWNDGIQVDRLAALDRLIVLTQHSRYEIVVVAPSRAEIVVRGGQFFPEFAPARLAGCTLGGSFLKVRGVYVGFRIEFSLHGRESVTTSAVKSIALASGSALPHVVM